MLLLPLLLLMCTLESKSEALPGYRLPDNVRPIHYQLNVITDLDEFSFSGDVAIKIKCLKPTNSIVLHSDNLKINNGSVTVEELKGNNSSAKLNVTDHKDVHQHSFHIINTEQSLEPHKTYLLYIPFSGVLLYTLDGYYRSSYFDRSSNLTKWLGVTQFAPTDARKAFPCFDEPAIKARFTIKLGHREHLKAICNMPQIKSTPMKEKPGWVWSEFQETVAMSVYLVAWIVSEFDYKPAPPLPNGVTFRVWTRKEAIEQARFANEIGPKILQYFENLFDIKYPLPKQDMIAVPDFRFSAMENWGLIIYRETVVLYDKKQSSIFDKELVASVISHELAHQWFGNLVTMKWWTDLWLNEGFATYIGSVGVNHVFPEWNHVSNCAMHNILMVLQLDALKSSHKISVEIGNPTEIDQIFDEISYKKGSTIIRTMHKFLGNSFIVGVSNYLKKHKYNNAEQDNLWDALTEQAHKDKVLDKNVTVKEIMDSWTLQTGYPMLTVTRDYDKGTATITQKRFLRIPSEQEKDNTCWWVPITYTTQKERNFTNTIPKTWLNCADKQSIVIEGLPVGKDNWVIFNIDLGALCRIQYDEHNWELIINTLNSDSYNTIGATNRAGLILDVFAFAKRGDLSYDLAFKLSSYLSRETEFIPYSEGLMAISSISVLLRRTPGFGVFKNYMQHLIEPIFMRYNKLTEIPSTLEEIKMHNLAVGWACSLEFEDCIRQTKELYEKWENASDLEKNNPIPTDLQILVFTTAVRLGDQKVWEKLWERYKVSNYGAEKRIIIEALACSRDVWIINRYLEWSIDENSELRRQDSATIFNFIMSQEIGFYVAKDFIHRKINDIYKYHESKPHVLGKYLTAYASKIIYEYELETFKEFLSQNAEYFKAAKLQADQGLENAIANVKWYSRNYETVMKMLGSLK